MKCLAWFELWLDSLPSVESSRSSSWNEDLSYYTRHQNAFSQSEVAVELYHSLHQSDMSLKELSQHIAQIGNLIYQVDLRQLVSQPKSRQRQMFAPIFDYVDISQAVAACHSPDSYGYVYFLVRLLYEVLLYTKSIAVRSLCFYQIMRNAHVISKLFGLVSREVSLKGTEGYIEGETPPTVDCMSTIDQLPSRFSINVVDNILHKMLVSKDMNLKICGIELMRLCPKMVACNPKLLGELKEILIEPMEECAHKAALSLLHVLQHVPPKVAQGFLHMFHDYTIATECNAQRVQSFCCLALGCRQLSVYLLAYRMCWNIWIHLEGINTTKESELLILKECQFYLMLTATVLCIDHPELVPRQKKRLESVIYEQKGRECTMEVAFCMNLLYREHGELREVGRLLKMDIKWPAVVNELNTTIFHLHLKNFKQTRIGTSFVSAINTFENLVAASLSHFTLLWDLKDYFKHLRTNYTDYILRILKVVQKHYGEMEGEFSYFRAISFRAIASLVRICYVCEPQKFMRQMGDIKALVKDTDLLYLFKPILSSDDFMELDDDITAERVNMWVHSLYYLGNIKPSKVHNIILRPLRVDLLSGEVKVDSATYKANIITKKDTFNADILNGHVRGLINSAYDKLSSGEALRNVINLSLRLGFYKEAAECLKQMEMWTDNTLLWFNGLYHYAVAECENDVMKGIEARVQGLDSLDAYHHQCTMWSLQKTANDIMAPRMNYTLPALVTHTWCTLKLILQIAICSVFKVMQTGSGDLTTLATIFLGLFGNYRALRWSFTDTCSETVLTCEIYEGLCFFMHALCVNQRKRFQGGTAQEDSESVDVKEKVDPEEALKQYIMQFFEADDVHLPQTLFLVDLLPPELRGRLYNVSSFIAIHTIASVGANKGETSINGQDESTPVISKLEDIPLSVIYKEFVLFTRVRLCSDRLNGSNNSTSKCQPSNIQSECIMACLSRDIESLTLLAPYIRVCETHKNPGNCWLDLLQRIHALKLPTPAGVLKNFPLPFPALTAVLEYEVSFRQGQITIHQKISNEGPVAVHIQGSIRNVS